MAPKRKILVGRDATEDFEKRRKFSEILQSLTIRDAPIRLDGRIFTLSHLQELCLENVGLHVERNQKLLKQLCRLSNLKTLSLANNQLMEIPDTILRAIPVGLQQLVLCANQLVELPRQLMRLRNLVALDASNNQLEHVHENVCLLRSLQFLKLQQNKLKDLPYSLLYGRRYRELNLTENPDLFSESNQERVTVSGSKQEVPNLKFITLARIFNCSERAECLLPEHINSERDHFLHRCFMCHRYMPFHGTEHVKHGQFDVRDCSEQVYYDRSEVLVNFVARVCINCRPKAVRLKIFP